MIDRLIQYWWRERDRAIAENQRLEELHYEDGRYIKGNPDPYSGWKEISASDGRIAIVEETLDRLYNLKGRQA